MKTIHTTNKIYLPSLNGVRFIAAAAVIIHHIEQIKFIHKIPNHFHDPCINDLGRLGVILFFVLSGFLITYLLLHEKKAGGISVGNFYIRRVLRIWPLYYLVVLAGLFILPMIPSFTMPEYSGRLHQDFLTKTLLFLFFAPNVALCAFPFVPYIAQAWSVGTEEQFYFIWPWLMKKARNTFFMLIAVMAVYAGAKGSVWLFKHMVKNSSLNFISDFLSSIPIDCMAIGGLAALALFRRRHGILRFIFDRRVQALVYIVTFFLVLKGVKIPCLHNEFYAALFAIIIINLAGNGETIFTLENRPCKYLGKISYGLYMYHPAAVAIALNLPFADPVHNSLILYLSAFIITILLSGLSYKFFEEKFIRAKIRYSRIVTGDNIPEPVVEK